MNLTSCSLLKYSYFNIYIYANLQRDSGQAAAIRLRFEKNVLSNLVLNDFPVVERGRHIIILHHQEDFLLNVINIRVFEDTMGASEDR